MTSARWKLGAGVLVVVAAAMVERARFTRASDQAARSRAMLQQAEIDAESIRVAQRETPWVGAMAAVEPDLSPRVLELMGRAGLDGRALKAVRQTRDEALSSGSGGSVRRRTVSVSLDGVTLEQIVAYLDCWEREVAEWTIARVDIQRHAGGNGEGSLRMELVRTYTAVRNTERTMARDG